MIPFTIHTIDMTTGYIQEAIIESDFGKFYALSIPFVFSFYSFAIYIPKLISLIAYNWKKTILNDWNKFQSILINIHQLLIIF